ncbi:MAG: hypothetical protein KY475_01135 [Planctomycetes bacterium]|nr:hypothetical protein [Planctomycetota bacterium]
MTMTHAEIDAVFEEIESRFPVEEWTRHGLRVWPLVRMRIYWACAVLLASGSERPSWSATLRARVGRELRMLARHAGAGLRERAKNLHHRRSEPCEVVLLSDGVSFTDVGGEYYERFCDPIQDHFASRGVTTFKLTPGVPLWPRYSPSMLVGTQLRRIRAVCAVRARLSQPADPPPGFSALAEFVQDRCGFQLNWGTFHRESLLVQRYSRFYESILTALRAKLGFVVSYYANEGFGFCLACRRLGIPSVDIQHGVQGDLHPAYGGWRRIPASGYEVLPQYFLVWSEAEAKAIQKWSAPRTGHHQALIAGNQFLQLCQAEQLRPVSQLAAQVRDLADPKAIQALYTLSFLETPSDIQDMLAAVGSRAPGRRIQWWVRVHPAGMHRLGEMRACLERAGTPAAQVNLATHLPLYALLPSMDVHVTGASSTVLEAESFGVRSVVVRELGAELYPSQLASGIALYAQGKDDILRAIHRQSERKAPREDVCVSAAQTLAAGRRILDDLLASAQRRATDDRDQHLAEYRAA